MWTTTKGCWLMVFFFVFFFVLLDSDLTALHSFGLLWLLGVRHRALLLSLLHNRPAFGDHSLRLNRRSFIVGTDPILVALSYFDVVVVLLADEPSLTQKRRRKRNKKR